jgi:hypothetical protein
LNVAEQLKLSGMERAAKKYQADLIRAQMIAETLGMAGELITTDDVRRMFQEHYNRPLKIHNAMGSIFDHSKWEFCGFVRSNRPEAHARMIRTWRLKKHRGLTDDVPKC